MAQEANISRHIDEAEAISIRKYELEAARRKRQLIYFLIITFAIVSIIVFLTLSNNKDLLVPLFTAAAGFVGGLGVAQRFRP